eukprot:757576-Hanusia_phi.AAC.4
MPTSYLCTPLDYHGRVWRTLTRYQHTTPQVEQELRWCCCSSKGMLIRTVCTHPLVDQRVLVRHSTPLRVTQLGTRQESRRAGRGGDEEWGRKKERSRRTGGGEGEGRTWEERGRSSRAERGEEAREDTQLALTFLGSVPFVAFQVAPPPHTQGASDTAAASSVLPPPGSRPRLSPAGRARVSWLPRNDRPCYDRRPADSVRQVP